MRKFNILDLIVFLVFEVVCLGGFIWAFWVTFSLDVRACIGAYAFLTVFVQNIHMFVRHYKSEVIG